MQKCAIITTKKHPTKKHCFSIYYKAATDLVIASHTCKVCFNRLYDFLLISQRYQEAAISHQYLWNPHNHRRSDAESTDRVTQVQGDLLENPV